MFKAYLQVHEPGMLKKMAGLNYWGYSISGKWGKERQAKDGDEPKPLCSYDYVRTQFNLYHDGPDKYRFQPRRSDQCAVCNKLQDKINVLTSLGIDCDEDLAQLNAHQQEKEKHLEGADRAYFRLRNYRGVSKNSYGLAGNADNALLGAALMRGEPVAPCSWKGGITYLAMDAGGSLCTPLVWANFAYFTCCLQTIPYWICN